MPVSPPLPVPSRAVPGRSYALSAIAFAVPPLGGDRRGEPSTVVPRLRRARAAGVTTFDVARATDPEAAETALARAFPDPDPELTVILGRPGPGRDGLAIDPSVRRIAGAARFLLEWDPSRGAGGTAPGAAVDRWRGEPRYADLVTPIGPDDVGRSGFGPGLRSGAVSLLRPELAQALGTHRAPEGFALVARDPFADGALDGSWLTGSPLAPAGGPPPPSLADLHARLDPVLRLGFLTRTSHRPLAEVALGFVLQWPWVASAVAPLPPIERLTALVAAATARGLTDDELAGLGFGNPDVRRTA